MLTERDAQEAERARWAVASTAAEVEDLIDRAREKGWTHRVGPLRAALATLHQIERNFEVLFR